MRKLATVAHAKVWGSPQTEPWFLHAETRLGCTNVGCTNVGEIWFASSPEFPLLVKLLFTAESMSVQVHPGDAYAQQHENSRGKTEMWHVLRAEPGAQVALGLRATITKQQLREAAQSGEIESLLNWVPARAGDTFFVPAGTIHAIGAGLVLCEVQQRSDVTYRLYDYGRPRELHLDRAADVAILTARENRPACTLPLECQYFRTESVRVNGVVRCGSPGKDSVYIVIGGEGLIAGEPFRPGDAWEVDAGSEPFEIVSPGAVFLVSSPSSSSSVAAL